MTTQIFTVDADEDLNVALPDRRVGLLQFTDDLLQDEHLEDELMLIFGKLIPLDCKHDYASGTTRFLCLSKDFDPVPLGDLIPDYMAVVTTDSQGNQTVSFVKTSVPLPAGTVNASASWPFPSKNVHSQPQQSQSAGSPAQDPAWSLTPSDDTIVVKGSDLPISIDFDLTDPTPVEKQVDKLGSIKDMFK